MPDRAATRPAANATPAHLAVRDWLLLALSFASGAYEAICFLSFGKVFSAFQTGNILFLGVGAAGTRPPAGPDPVTVVISLAAFAAGAAVAMPILRAFGPEADVPENDIRQVWPRHVSVALGVTLLLEAGFLAVWMTTSPSDPVTYLLVALNASAMGLQMNAIRSLRVPGVSTTAFTATFINLVSGITTWSLGAPTVRRLTGTIVSMAAGAFLGDWMLSHAHHYAPLVPALVIALVIAIGSMALKPGPAQPS
jgi:uncharacterized membrane protein YoaK (UPF0700 family)